MTSVIIVNLFAELLDQAAALSFKSTVQARLTAFGIAKHSEVRRSARFPNLFDVFFILQPNIDAALAFDGILSSLGEGWERHDISNQEQSADWNDRDGIGFFSSDVRVACLDCFPEAHLRDLRLSCSSLGEFSRSVGRLFRALPLETRQHLHEIRKAYFGTYGIEGAYERMNNRTVSQIFAEYRPVDVKPIASGEVDGVRYELYEPRSDAIENESEAEGGKGTGP